MIGIRGVEKPCVFVSNGELTSLTIWPKHPLIDAGEGKGSFSIGSCAHATVGHFPLAPEEATNNLVPIGRDVGYGVISASLVSPVYPEGLQETDRYRDKKSVQ